MILVSDQTHAKEMNPASLKMIRSHGTICAFIQLVPSCWESDSERYVERDKPLAGIGQCAVSVLSLPFQGNMPAGQMPDHAWERSRV
jgi:hypothetical protein